MPPQEGVQGGGGEPYYGGKGIEDSQRVSGVVDLTK